jgi:hypothetical protein
MLSPASRRFPRSTFQVFQITSGNLILPCRILLAGRAPLRLVMVLLPTHREVMTASQRISAPGCCFPPPAPVRSTACLPSTPPREHLPTGQTSHVESHRRRIRTWIQVSRTAFWGNPTADCPSYPKPGWRCHIFADSRAGFGRRSSRAGAAACIPAELRTTGHQTLPSIA